jgi:CelD/BcsL family acetyltransferase involved in cellulose biosynthesis
VIVETPRDEELIGEYFELCRSVSSMKGFELRTSVPLIKRLLDVRSADSEARLFVGRQSGKIAAGALAVRCGQSIHYFGGASDRAFTKQHPGEAVHWAIIEWGLAQGCALYDLEGIDPQGNPGTYAFKKKMGGEEVALARREVTAIDVRGRLLAPLAAMALNTQLAAIPALARSYWPRRRSWTDRRVPT